MKLRLANGSLLLLCGAIAAYGQLTRGFISGTVQDASSALVEGVKVTITNVDTGINHESMTNSAGCFVLWP
jgi:hypothetical protein